MNDAEWGTMFPYPVPDQNLFFMGLEVAEAISLLGPPAWGAHAPWWVRHSREGGTGMRREVTAAERARRRAANRRARVARRMTRQT